MEEGALPGHTAKADPKLVKLIARAHLSHQKPAESTGEHLDQVANGLGLTRSYLTRVLRLTLSRPRHHPGDPRRSSSARLHGAEAALPFPPAARLAGAAANPRLRLDSSDAGGAEPKRYCSNRE